MKNILPILILAVIMSCSNKEHQETSQNIIPESPAMTDKEFVAKLIKNDFFKFADPMVDINQTDSLDIYSENINKFARIDAEELAEFNFDYFLPQLSKMLAKRNIKLSVSKSIPIENTHEISINQNDVVLYSKEELENQTFWTTAPIHFFKKLNQILEEKKSDERFYLINDGNDLSTFLLTNSQFKLFQNRYKSEINEIPRKS